jgi:hypothetical protein
MSDSSEERHRKPKHSWRRTERPRKEDRTRSINTLLSDEEEDFIQEMPEAALVAAQVMSTHASVLVDSVGPPSVEVCRAAASFP